MWSDFITHFLNLDVESQKKYIVGIKKGVWKKAGVMLWD